MKGVIIKVFISIIILSIAGQGIFWFFKTSITKKYITSSINSLGSDVKVENISVTGFPISQKISIKNLELKPNIPQNQYAQNQYSINIGNLVAQSSIFKNDFTVTTFDNISFKDSNDNSGDIIFNKFPKIKFLIAEKKIQKLTYHDSGYKIINEREEVLYEGGKSAVDFQSITEDKNKIRHKIKIDFHDMYGIDIFNTQKLATLDSSRKLVNEKNLEDLKDNGENSATLPPQLPNPTEIASSESEDTQGETKAEVKVTEEISNKEEANIEEEITLDEIVELPKIEDNDIVEEVEVQEIVDEEKTEQESNKLGKRLYLKIDYLLIVNHKKDKDGKDIKSFMLSEINISDLEFSIPSYSINLSGQINVFDKPTSINNIIETCDLELKVRNIENILSYIKQLLPQAPQKNTETELLTTESEKKEITKEDTNVATNATKAPEEVVEEKPTLDSIIMSLAKDNLESTSDLSMFKIKKESNSDFIINGTELSELITKISLLFTNNQEVENKEIVDQPIIQDEN